MPINSTGLSDTSGSSPAAPPLDYPKTVANVFAYCAGTVPPGHGPEGLDGLLRPPMSRAGNGTSLGSAGDGGGGGGLGDDDDDDDDEKCLLPSEHPDLPNDYSVVDTNSGGLSFGPPFGQSQQQQQEGGSYGSSGSKTPVLLPSQQHIRLSGLDGPPEVRFIMPQDEMGLGEDDLSDVVNCADKNQDGQQSSGGGGSREIDGLGEHSGTPLMVRVRNHACLPLQSFHFQ